MSWITLQWCTIMKQTMAEKWKQCHILESSLPFSLLLIFSWENTLLVSLHNQYTGIVYSCKEPIALLVGITKWKIHVRIAWLPWRASFPEIECRMTSSACDVKLCSAQRLQTVWYCADRTYSTCMHTVDYQVHYYCTVRHHFHLAP